MGNPDYQLTLLKESMNGMACLCVHHGTNVDFGGWSNCANAVPRGRDHAVNSYFTEYRSCAQQYNGLQQQKKPAQRLAAFRRKEKKIEPECLKFCHLGEPGDYAKHYREKKHSLYVEKMTNKLGLVPVVQLNEGTDNTCAHEAKDVGKEDASV